MALSNYSNNIYIFIFKVIFSLEDYIIAKSEMPPTDGDKLNYKVLKTYQL